MAKQQDTSEMHALFDSAAAASDPATAAKLRALSNLHSAKVHALMRSIHALRDEVGLLKAQAKEHRRSALIQSLRGQLREQELCVDVLKGLVAERAKLSEEQVNSLVATRTPRCSMGGDPIPAHGHTFSRVCERSSHLPVGGGTRSCETQTVRCVCARELRQ